MRPLVVVAFSCLPSVVCADTSYLGIYIGRNKIGYASYRAEPTFIGGKAATESESKTVLHAVISGSPLSVTIDSRCWSTPAGRPIKLWSTTQSGGRQTKVDATFVDGRVLLTTVSGGVKNTHTVPLPKNGTIVEDPVDVFLKTSHKDWGPRTFYVLDPMTAAFLETHVVEVGPATAKVLGKAVDAKLVRVSDPRSTMDVFVNAKGDLVRVGVHGPLGIYMVPVSKELALAPSPKTYDPSRDLGELSGIKPDKKIDDAAHLSYLSICFSGGQRDEIPSDAYQTAIWSAARWQLEIHPAKLESAPKGTIVEAEVGKAAWIQEAMYMPSNAPEFKRLATKIVGSKNLVQDAAFAIQIYVYQIMKPNGGIGVLRDATEVLKTKEGVCRDYAILTVTLLRAAGIPARLVGGLVDWDDEFYYHAWAEAWDGQRWIGVDSTTDSQQLSASHIKLGQGNVDSAFSFSFLDTGKIEVLEARQD